MKKTLTPFKYVTRLLLCLLFTLLLCVGCGKSDETYVTSEGESLPAEEETEEAVPTGDEEDPIELDAITLLAFFAGDSVPTLSDLGEGLVLCSWVDFTDDVTTVCVIDILRGEILRSMEMEGYYTLEKCTTDGTAILLAGDGSCYILLDGDFSVTCLTLPVSLGIFSADGSEYYYDQDSTLYTYSLSAGESSALDLQGGFRVCSLTGVYTDLSLVDCDVYTSLYSYLTCQAVVNGDTGELLLLRDDLSNLSLTEGGFYSYDWRFVDETDTEVCVLVFGSYSDSDTLYTCELMESTDVYTELTLVEGSPYLLQTNWVWEDEDCLTAEITSTLWRMNDDGTIDCCVLDPELLALPLYNLLYLQEEDLLVVAGYENSASTLAVLNPEAMDFVTVGTAEAAEDSARVNQTLLAALEEEKSGTATPEYLSDVRERADEIESLYNVHILLGDACVAPAAISNYTVTSTTDAGYADEAAMIDAALDALEEVLALYPADYFSQMGTDNPEDGVYFLLVGPIESTNGVIGFACTMDQREYIAVDVTCDLISALCHEIWHATESRLSAWGYDLVLYGGWEELNPDGFCYLYSYDLSTATDSLYRYAYYGGWDEIYFVDDYSQTFPKEDRARLMEYIMTDDTVAQQLLQSSHIRAKLELLCDAIRSCFDTTDWGDLWWERYL